MYMYVYVEQIYRESHRVGATPEEALVPALAFWNTSKHQYYSIIQIFLDSVFAGVTF